jgi:SAM-dependent methyltransferase
MARQSSAPSYGRSGHYLGDRGEAYFAYLAREIRETGARIELRKFARFIHKDDCVIDFGCGGGFMLKYMDCGRRIGVEVNPAAARVAIQNNIECYADLGEVPDSVADVVVSNHALEHVPYPIQALREIHRTLRTEGHLVLVVPIDDWRKQTNFTPGNKDNHLYTWTPQLLGNCLSEAGFDPGEVSIRVLSHAWFPGYHRVWSAIPDGLFDWLCRFFSILVKRRQLVAIARKG